jgi:hypothetical protein
MIMFVRSVMFKGQKKARLWGGPRIGLAEAEKGASFLPVRWARGVAVGRPTPPQATRRTGKGRDFANHFNHQATGVA